MQPTEGYQITRVSTHQLPGFQGLLEKNQPQECQGPRTPSKTAPMIHTFYLKGGPFRRRRDFRGRGEPLIEQGKREWWKNTLTSLQVGSKLSAALFRTHFEGETPMCWGIITHPVEPVFEGTAIFVALQGNQKDPRSPFWGSDSWTKGRATQDARCSQAAPRSPTSRRRSWRQKALAQTSLGRFGQAAQLTRKGKMSKGPRVPGKVESRVSALLLFWAVNFVFGVGKDCVCSRGCTLFLVAEYPQQNQMMDPRLGLLTTCGYEPKQVPYPPK